MSGISEKDIAKALQRPGALPAFLTAIGVLAFLILSNVVNRLLDATASAFYGSSSPASYWELAWGIELADALGGPVFFALGVFLCLWQVAPIAPTLRLGHVVTRAVLAAVVGAACLWVLKFFASFIFAIANLELHLHPEHIGNIAFDALISSLSALVGLLPLVALGAVFLWGWLQRHPPKNAVTGTLDEV